MFFKDDIMKRVSTSSISDQLRVEQKCSVCPLIKLKTFADVNLMADVLVISNKKLEQIDSSDLGILSEEAYTYHAYDVECGTNNAKAPEAAKACCLGRKLDLIARCKPKVVIAVGEVFKSLEIQLTGSIDPKAKLPTYQYVKWPCEYQGHKFWMIYMEQPNPDYWEPVTKKIADIRPLIISGLHESVPQLLKFNADGLEYITHTKDITAALKDLRTVDYIGCDIETYGDRPIRPYADNSKILTIALSRYDRTFVFPLFHPQTPSTFDPIEFFYELLELGKEKHLVYHNGMFEMEWFAYNIGLDFNFEVNHDDTMAMVYLIHHMMNSKSLNVNLRRYAGDWLKALSNIDVTKLHLESIENVMKYNGMDAKYTIWLYHRLVPLLKQYRQEQVYKELQMPREASFVDMQLTGIAYNPIFIAAEREKQINIKLESEKRIYTIPEVSDVIRKKGSFDLDGRNDIPDLFHTLGYHPPINDKGNETFDKKWLPTVPHPFAKELLIYRSAGKLISTYLDPYRIGENVWSDGLVHTSYNIMLTRTGRTSSSDPNLQNLASKDGKKYTRAVLQAWHVYLAELYGCSVDDLVCLEADQGQIEYRIAASISMDPELIKAIWEDYDVHLDQALLWSKIYPDKYLSAALVAEAVKCGCSKCKACKTLKAWRNRIKNEWVFQSLYGAVANTVARYFECDTDDPKFQQLFEGFWSKFAGVKNWQIAIRELMAEQGHVESPFGRIFPGPLTPNQITNYPIQSSASDLLISSQVKLSRLGYELDKPWIKPVLNIHDANYWIIPKNKVDEVLSYVVPAMLHTKTYKLWLKVPLTVEVSLGKDLGSMSEIGKYKSTDFKDEAA